MSRRRADGSGECGSHATSKVGHALREQALSALDELVRGFDQADRRAGGALLGARSKGRLKEIRLGLITTIMRLVVLLYATERGLLPSEDELPAASYSLSGLFAQLALARAAGGENLRQHCEAWERLTGLFRLVHGGNRAEAGPIRPAHGGALFDPEAFPFLEARPNGVGTISDDVVAAVLERLLVVGGEKVPYASLEIEQIGGIYERLMGFELRVADGESMVLLPDHAVVDLEELLRCTGPLRSKLVKSRTGLILGSKTAEAIRTASTIDALEAALMRRMSGWQRGRISRGSLYLHPGDERRKSGSHYTPRSLTLPVVELALCPVLERLLPNIDPDQILELRVCDPAMGGGAFLLEACRQLASHLLAAWSANGTTPELLDRDDLLAHARRLVARHCLYGVDQNALAVELARSSLWLLSSARGEPFSFLNHALRVGDSLVGITRTQIHAISLDPDPEDLDRRMLDGAPIADPVQEKKTGDWLVHAFFSGESDRERRRAVLVLRRKLASSRGDGRLRLDRTRSTCASGGDGPARPNEAIVPLHWEIEFPEVFFRSNPGFDCFVGNPPFLGGKRISTVLGPRYRDWLSSLHEGANSNADLAAHFFRRAYGLLRQGGTCGFIATNTIAQGDTRSSGLGWLCGHGAVIYSADARVSWPGEAMVVASVVHVCKGVRPSSLRLNGQEVSHISPSLDTRGGHDDPARLSANADQAFIGCFVRGKGFIFDDASEESSPLSVMRRILEKDPTSAEVVYPFLGGEEVLSSPTHDHKRYIIRFGARSEDEIQRWPLLYEIVARKVRPFREARNRTSVDRTHRRFWWRFGNDRPELYGAIGNRPTVLVIPRMSQHLCLVFLRADIVFSDQLVVIPRGTLATFALLSSRVHNDWVRTFASTLGDGLRYTPSDCFETFPFPAARDSHALLSSVGETYYRFRASLMQRTGEGLTKIYNRFHAPEDCSADVQRLRELHAALDRAVLDAYGWNEVRPEYEFREQLDGSTRLTWNEETHHTVLTRLLERNRIESAGEAPASRRSRIKNRLPTSKAL